MNNKAQFILGLTGSIAMGKSTVSNMFRELGVKVWCADNEVNELYKKHGAATKLFYKEFPSVVKDNGVDKHKLRSLIHKDSTILKKIEEIVHPLLENSKVDFIESNKDLPLIIFDIPLLFEKKKERSFDAVLVVTASEKTQRNRALSRENMTEEGFNLIKRNQMNEKEKIKRADFLINTEKSLLNTKKDVARIYQKITGVQL